MSLEKHNINTTSIQLLHGLRVQHAPLLLLLPSLPKNLVMCFTENAFSLPFGVIFILGGERGGVGGGGRDVVF